MTPNANNLFSSVLVIILLVFLYTAESSGQARKARSEGFDPNEPPETKYQILPYLTFGSQLEFEFKLDRNLDLDGSTNEDLITIEPAINLAFSFDPFSFLQAFVNFKIGGEFEIEDGRNKKDRAIFEVEEAYLFFKDLFEDRFSFQIGRQQFDDERQWLYDAELDGARAFILHWGIVTQLSFSRGGFVNRDLLRKDAGDKTNNYAVYSTYYFNEDTNIAAYFLARDDTTGENNSPIFLGVHSDGEVSGNMDYWLELAYVTGKEGSNSISGFGFDVGSTYAFDVRFEPSLTLGYAFGSREFRQSGLQGNEGDFNGVVDFLYYGEFFEPELSNMSIITTGTGINPTEESSIDLVYHYYFQTKALDELRDSNLDVEPNGINNSLGNEIDLILGYEQKEEKLAIAISFGYFIPGSAFPSDAINGFLAKLVMAYEF
jgi:alginate production protein